MKLLQWIKGSVAKKGVIQTGKVAVNFALDLFFDWRYGTDTLKWVPVGELETASGNKPHSAPYQATKARPFLRLLHRLDLPRESVFVDIGSGKGRALLVAAQYGFRKVVGIEFSGALCALARKNAAIFGRKVRLLSPIEVIEADATTYDFRAEERVLFMYNPFDAQILSQVIANIRRSLEACPRKLWLIYNTPQHHQMISAAGIFKSDSFHEIGGNHFRVYES
jgi:SAM-dependent methyltransferase